MDVFVCLLTSQFPGAIIGIMEGVLFMKKVSILALHLGFGGIERCIASLANMLVPYYEVEIICIYKLYQEPAFSIDPHVKIHYLVQNRKPNEQEFYQALSNKKLITALKEGVKAAKTLYLKKHKMIEAIKKSDADIMIATRDIFDEWLSLYGRENVLKIGWEHNHHHQNIQYVKTIVCSCKNLDYLVLVSKDLKNFYEKEMQNMKCKCIYIPNTLEKIPDTLSRLNQKRFISIGRLTPEKGYDDLVDLAISFSKKFKDWHLDIVGDGKERKNLEEQIKKNHLESYITLHGFQKSDYIQKLLNQSSIYLMTSKTESFGIVLLEAMSHGIPCIAYHCAEGAREIIQSGYNGYLIKNRNKEAYIKKVSDLVNNEDIRKELGAHARKTIEPYRQEKVLLSWKSLLERN